MSKLKSSLRDWERDFILKQYSIEDMDNRIQITDDEIRAWKNTTAYKIEELRVSMKNLGISILNEVRQLLP